MFKNFLTKEPRLEQYLNMFNIQTAKATPEPKPAAGPGKKGELTRSHILAAALRLFRERGFDSATMRDIAEAAGMSLGASYYYFPSKESIVSAYYDYVQHEHKLR